MLLASCSGEAEAFEAPQTREVLRYTGFLTGFWTAERADRDEGSVEACRPARGKPGSLWILNARYELGAPTDAEAHDERHKRMLASGEVEPARVGDWVETDSPGLTATGGGLGCEGDPGAGWRRLRWRELADRVGDTVVPLHAR